MQRIKTIGEDLAAVHGYLCADGYVISHKRGGKRKYYLAALRNTEIALLEDFTIRFERVFGLRPKISIGANLASLHSKEIYRWLTETFGPFYSYKWRFPKIFRTKKLKAIWLRAVFDCESWVNCKKGADRHIGIEMVNRRGIIQIRGLLSEFKIPAKFKARKTRNIFRLNIFGKGNIETFRREIGFLHPKKKAKLQEALDSYVEYNWAFPKKKEAARQFALHRLGRQKGQDWQGPHKGMFLRQGQS